MGLLTNLTGIAMSHEGRHEEALDLFEQAESVYLRLAMGSGRHGEDQPGVRALALVGDGRRGRTKLQSIERVGFSPKRSSRGASSSVTTGVIPSPTGGHCRPTSLPHCPIDDAIDAAVIAETEATSGGSTSWPSSSPWIAPAGSSAPAATTRRRCSWRKRQTAASVWT